MNIDIESIGLLSLILQDSPKDRLLILCVLARSNSVPARITFNPNTDYPTFYGYSNSRIPFYLMNKGVLSNAPREGYTKRLISSYYLSYAETVINRAKNWDLSKKLESVSKFITLDNKTKYKDAEVFLVFRNKALEHIKGYATQHKEELSTFLGHELSREIFKTTGIKSEEKIEKVYKPKVIPDRTNELIRKAEQARARQHKEMLAERRHRQHLKEKRILAAKVDKFTHAINLITERAEYQKTKNDSFSIDYHDFNFEDTMDESRVLEGFLEKLKIAGAIKSYSRQNYSGGTRFGFRGVVVSKLKEYKVHGEKIIKDMNSPKPQRKKPSKKTEQKANWSEDFVWQGKTFIFGQYGKRKFSTKTTQKMFRTLTEAKGGWVTVKKLKELAEKDENYVRQTLWQIANSFKPKLKKYISLPSTTNDNLKPKPPDGVGAYRIKFTPNPQ